jgi:hypothetical protein
MNHDPHSVKSNGHGDFERKDISVNGVVIFLVGLAAMVVISYFVVDVFYHALEKHFEAQQAPVSPLVTNAQQDTRRIPPQYGEDYAKYLKESFPAPQLETDERHQLNEVRLREEDILSTYDYVDKSAGTVRIPIDRAMDLLTQKGLPVLPQTGGATAQTAKSQPEQQKGTKQ